MELCWAGRVELHVQVGRYKDHRNVQAQDSLGLFTHRHSCYIHGRIQSAKLLLRNSEMHKECCIPHKDFFVLYVLKNEDYLMMINSVRSLSNILAIVAWFLLERFTISQGACS